MGSLLYKKGDVVDVGGIHRFVVTYTPNDINEELGRTLVIRIKNNENILMAPAFLNGPYILYADIRESDWNYQNNYFSTNEQPVFEPNINPGQSLTHKLTLNKIQSKYVWTIDIISQIIFSTTADIAFELIIAWDSENSESNFSSMKDGNYSNGSLTIEHMNKLDLWNRPALLIDKPIHLVILTHGLHSNTTADMSYMKDQIELMAKSTGENIVVRGYSGNVCKTERGVKYLGRRLGEYVVNDSVKDLPRHLIKKISFIGHSLGGLVQTFALSYINVNYPDFFKEIVPENFVTMASPLLGISNENPAYVKICLKFGIVGKSGQDLNLQGDEPLLLLIPSEPTRKVLKMFKRRSVYANVINDGIVPLRTSALLYLDWKGLSNVYQAMKAGKITNLGTSNETISDSDDNEATEIPNQISMSLDDISDDSDDNGENGIKPSFINIIKGRVQSTIGFCLPSLGTQQRSMSSKYKYFQAQLDTDNDTIDEEDELPNEEGANHTEVKSLLAIPKSNVITSIKRVILPPLPSPKYINDPNSRQPSIIHDKIYTPNMIPKTHTQIPSSKILAQLDLPKKHRYLEEKIARRWHLGMSWRKILVVMKPDAHNNMIVRRRFANAYGWAVVDHMVKENFGEKCMRGEDLKNWNNTTNEEDDLNKDLDIEESGKLAENLDDVLEHEWKKEHPNKGVEEVQSHLSISDIDDSWLDESVNGYYDGPTGMINNVSITVNESVDAVKRGILGAYDYSNCDDAVTKKLYGDKCNNLNDSDGDINIDIGLNDLNQVSELNAYL